MNKIVRGLCVALGIALYGGAYYLYNNFINVPEMVQLTDCNYKVENNDESSGSAKMVMVKGKIKPEKPAVDSLTGVKANYVILQRNVEVYQYFQDGEKVMMGWKNYPVKNFKDKKGKEWKNPKFPSDLKNLNFYTNFTVNDGNLEVSREFLKRELKIDKYKKNFHILNNLPQAAPNGFVWKKNHYLKTASDKTKIGSIRVYYKVLDQNELPELTIIGQQKKALLSRSNSDCRFYDRPVEMAEIEKTYNQDAPDAALGAVFFGTFFVLLGMFKGRS